MVSFQNQFQPHPFRLLLYLEWLLVLDSVIAMVTTIQIRQANLIISATQPRAETALLLFLILVFALLGLRLPKDTAFNSIKYGYLITELALVGLITFVFDFQDDSASVLLVVLLLRSSLMLQTTALWAMILSIFGIYLFQVSLPVINLWSNSDAALISQIQVDGTPLQGLPDGGIRIELNPSMVQHFLATVRTESLRATVAGILSFAIILAFVLILVKSLLGERQARRRLAQAYQQIYQHALRIEDQAIVEERTRIARELHDTLGHLLVAQHIQLENALLSLQSNSTADLAVFLQESQKLTSKALKNVRQAVTILRDEPEEFIPFEAAVAEIVEEFHQMSPIRIQSNVTLPAQLPQSLQLAARRILTEALTNIHKHSQATDASVTIEIKPLATDEAPAEPLVETALWVSVSDNGCGIRQPESASGFGLRGMRERVQSFGGRLTIESQPGAGCHLSAVLPIQGGTR